MNAKMWKLAVLLLCHLTVDFYAGLTLPLPEPTLINHYGASLGRVMLLVAAAAIVCNAVQPLAGLILPRRPLPWLLWVCPLLAATVALIGFATNYAVGWLLFMVSAVGIGVMHPEAVLAAQALSGRRIGMVTALFMSVGFFGFSLGSLAGGWWGARWGLTRFWLLAAPAFATAAMVWASGLCTLRSSRAAVPDDDVRGPLPFASVFAVGSLMAVNLTLLYRLLPVFMVRRFGDPAQADAGTLLFLVGLFGAVGGVSLGMVSDRLGTLRTMVAVYLAGLPAVLMLLRMSSATAGFGWAVLTGLTIGGSFPLAVMLARQAKSFPLRLRIGLGIGGAWGLGEFSVILASYYIDMFPEGDYAPVRTMLYAAPALMGIIILLAIRLARQAREMEST